MSRFQEPKKSLPAETKVLTALQGNHLTVKEISRESGVSIHAVHDIIVTLMRDGKIVPSPIYFDAYTTASTKTFDSPPSVS